jgi:acetyl esterase/lipase
VPASAGAVLLSPWLDIADRGTSPSWRRYAAVDYLPLDLTTKFAE